ncbi:NADPH:quinone reductase [Nocardia sp. NPDC046763]|uniref:NADPH:quinone reductase n=1 Tax=Nocardia sp. NPDC046763 TaxID=3155256 RepID=UPI0033F5AF6D
MRAAWYERTGPAAAVLEVGELPDPEPGHGQIRVRLEVAGISRADVRLRSGIGSRAIRFGRVIPGDDGAGVIDKLGPGVPATRLGQRVWVHSATYATRGGTAAEYVVVPANRAIELPDNVPTEVGACLGLPALTAHRCLFADGPMDGSVVLITGGTGAVSHYAIQMARNAGAIVIATAGTAAKRAVARTAGADHVFDYRDDDVIGQILHVSPTGVDRIVDVAFGAYLPISSTVIAPGGTISGYASNGIAEPVLPFTTLLRAGATIRTVMVYAMPPQALRHAIDDVTDLISRGILAHPIASRYALDQVAEAHARVESGQGIGRVLLACR